MHPSDILAYYNELALEKQFGKHYTIPSEDAINPADKICIYCGAIRSGNWYRAKRQWVHIGWQCASCYERRRQRPTQRSRKQMQAERDLCDCPTHRILLAAQ